MADTGSNKQTNEQQKKTDTADVCPPQLAVHTDKISTLWSHAHAKEKEEAHIVSGASFQNNWKDSEGQFFFLSLSLFT